MASKRNRAEYMREYRKSKREETSNQTSTEVITVDQKSVLPIDSMWGKTADKPPNYHIYRKRVWAGTEEQRLASKERKNTIDDEDFDEEDYEEDYDERACRVVTLPPVHNFVKPQLPPPPKQIAPPPTYRIGQFFNCKKCDHWQCANVSEECTACHSRYKFDADRSHALSDWLDPNLGEILHCSYCGKPHQIKKMCTAKKRAMKNVYR